MILILDETRTFTRSKRWIIEREKESILLLSEDKVLKIHEEKLLDIFGALAGYIQLFMDITFEAQKQTAHRRKYRSLYQAQQ